MRPPDVSHNAICLVSLPGCLPITGPLVFLPEKLGSPSGCQQRGDPRSRCPVDMCPAGHTDAAPTCTQPYITPVYTYSQITLSWEMGTMPPQAGDYRFN